MRRIKLVFLSGNVIALLGMTMLFSQCQLNKPVEPTPLGKGQLLSDPLFKGNSVGLIKTQYIEDENLSASNLQRPKDVTSYVTIQNMLNKSIIRSINSTPPDFRWTKTNQKFVMVAIFCNPIKIKNNEIDNKEDIVWLWVTEKGDPGIAKYAAGNKATYTDNSFKLDPPVALLPKLYVWSVWTWDDTGLQIMASSRELPIRVNQ